MKKLFLFVASLALSVVSVYSQDEDKTIIERVNEATEIPVYIYYQPIDRGSISSDKLNGEEMLAAQQKVEGMSMPNDFRVLSDSLIALLNKKFSTNKFVYEHLKAENFNNIGLINWEFEKRPIFVFINITTTYEVSDMMSITRNNDVDQSISIKWALSITSNIAFSHVKDEKAYRVYANYAAVYKSPAFSVKYIPTSIEYLATVYAPSKSISPFCRKFEFFTDRFTAKQKKILEKKKK